MILFFFPISALSADPRPESRNCGERVREALQSLKEEESQLHQNQIASLRDSYLTRADGRDKALAALSLGAHYLQGDTPDCRISIQYLSAAESGLVTTDPFIPVVFYYRALADICETAFEPAVNKMRAVLSSALGSAWKNRAYGHLIEALHGKKDYHHVVEVFREYSTKFKVSRHQEELVKIAAISLENSGATEEVEETLEQLAQAYPLTDVSKWAFRKLRDLSEKEIGSSGEKSYFFSTKLLSRMGQNRQVDPAFQQFIMKKSRDRVKTSLGEIRKLAEVERLEFLFDARQYERALELSQELSGGGKIHPSEREVVLFYGGRTAGRLKKFDLAAQFYSTYLDNFPQGRFRKRALEAFADAEYELTDYTSAAKIYGLLASRSKNSEHRWNHFWNVYLSGDLAGALTLIQTPGYVSDRDSRGKGCSTYWHARILEKLQRGQDAQEHFKKLLEQEADSFYASLILARFPEFAKAKNETIAGESLGHDGTKTVSEPGNSKLPMDLSLARDLAELGLYDGAALQLKGVDYQKLGQNSEALKTASTLAWKIGDYRPARRLLNGKTFGLSNTPGNFWDLKKHQEQFYEDWKMYYPIAYEKIVDTFASEAGIDRYWLLSIMRAESYYNRDARSWVGATGLMQIMPYTAKRISEELKDGQATQSDLSDPLRNIGYGAYYLKRLYSYYGNNIVLSVAAYNAGPLAVDRWLGSRRDRDIDEFIEEIPYTETRQYVKKVLRNFAQYNQIYQNQVTSLDQVGMPAKMPSEGEIF